MTNLPKEVRYPSNYSFKDVSNFLKKLDPNSCSTLVGPAGFGKSNFLRFITYNDTYRELHKFNTSLEFVYIDLSILFEVKPIDFILIISLGILDLIKYKNLVSAETITEIKNELNSNTNLHIALHVFDKLLNYLKSETTVHLILDNVEKIFKFSYIETLDLIKFIRDKFGNRLQFIFAINNLNLLKEIQERKFGRISDILLHNIYFLGLEKNPKNFYLNINKDLNIKQITNILKFSGGLPSYVKQLVLSDSNLVINENLKQLTDNTSLKLVQCLTPKQISFIKNINKFETVDIETELTQLILLGIVEKNENNYTVFSPIFEEYINKYNPNDSKVENYSDLVNTSRNTIDSEFLFSLTKNEADLMRLLLNYQNDLVDRDKAIETLWGNNSLDQYSNWALDQLILRIRKKLETEKPNYKIITKRGRGYILVNNG